MDRTGAVVDGVEKSLAQSGPLQNDGGYKEIKTHGAVSILFQERHQEAETDKHHNVDVLKHLKKIRPQIKIYLTLPS